ncbi:MAG TPA: U32 family peptidase [Microlunatus sp.]|nr:U32 family peptidase [Microlunatus sp.]
MLGADLLTSLGVAAAADLPASEKRFADGAHFRIEIPSTEGPSVSRAVLEEAGRRGIRIHRMSQGSGVTMLSRDERADWVRLGAEHDCELSLYVRPTASWGTGAGWTTQTGRPLAGQAHGAAQLAAALDQVRRACADGFRGVLITDLGVLAGVNELRERGELPAELSIKVGVQMSVANPLAARTVERLGAGTINVPSDCTLADLAAIRAAVDVPLDIYIESPDDLGGFVRVHEIADIVRVAAPVYLKFGLRNAPGLYPSGTHLDDAARSLARERVRRTQLGLELLAELAPELITTTGRADLAVPVPPPA